MQRMGNKSHIHSTTGAGGSARGYYRGREISSWSGYNLVHRYNRRTHGTSGRHRPISFPGPDGEASSLARFATHSEGVIELPSLPNPAVGRADTCRSSAISRGNRHVTCKGDASLSLTTPLCLSLSALGIVQVGGRVSRYECIGK